MSEVVQSQLDRFDWERGDVLSIAREDAARLAALPVEMFAPPFHALLRWFLGEDAESVRKSLKDPRDVMILEGLIEHQRGNAKRRGDYLTMQREKSLIAKSRRSPTGVPRESHGRSVDTSISRSLSVSDKTSTTSVGVACPSVAPPAATDGGEVIRIRGKDYSAKQVLAMLAPKDYFGHIDSEEEDKEYYESSFAAATDEQIEEFLCNFIEGGFTAEELGLPTDAGGEAFSVESERRLTALRDETARKMFAFRKEYGKEVLGRVMWRLDCKKSQEPYDETAGALTWARRVCETLEVVARALESLRRTPKRP